MSKINETKLSSIMASYKDGSSVIKLAKDFSVNAANIYYALRRNRVQMRNRGRKKGTFTSSSSRKISLSEIPNVIDRYLNKKESICKIASDYGVSRQAIDGLLKTRNIHRAKISFRKIDPSEFSTIVSKFHELKNISEVAKEYGVAPASIVRILESQGIASNMYVHHVDLNNQQIKRIIARYQNGEFAKNIAKDYNLPSFSIWSILQRNGIRRSPDLPRPKKIALSQYPRIKKDVKRGFAIKDIAVKYKLSREGASLIVKNLEKCCK